MSQDKLKIPFLTAGSMHHFEDKRERYRAAFWAWYALVHIMAGLWLTGTAWPWIKLLIPRWVV